MYICVCNAVTEERIQQAVEREGVRDFAQLQAKTGVATCCGCCEMMARQVLDETLETQGSASWHSAA